MPLKITDEDFIATWQRIQNASKVAEVLGLSHRQTNSRKRSLEARYGISLPSIDKVFYPGNSKHAVAAKANELAQERASRYEDEMHGTLLDGVLMVGSDAHYWPGIVSAAHESFCKLAKRLSPKMIVLNGDIMDGARISRHPRVLWQKLPTVKDEVHAMQDRCAEIERAAPRAMLVRTIGNHDARFENYLCGHAPEFDEMTGTSLLHYLPRWRAGWALHLNADTEGWTVIRHRHVTGGIHSAYNSTLKAGVNYVHGHLHKLQCTPLGDYRGRRYGVDCGTLAEPKGPQFAYTEGGPLNWGSGFYVLTFKGGRLLPPEPCTIDRGKAWFRGEEV